MKTHLQQLFLQAVTSLISKGILPADCQPTIQISAPRDPAHGDFACNIAMMLAKPAKKNPRELAQQLIDATPASERVAKLEIAGPGFINIFQTSNQLSGIVADILNAGDQYGTTDVGKGINIQLEYVSANPTGPLHIGHGRGAAYGATLANLLTAVGYQVQREYYVNDAGRQMDILATSVWLRYLEKSGASFDFPSNGYKGAYVYDIADAINQQYGQQFQQNIKTIFADVPDDEPAGGDKEIHIDALISVAKNLLGETDYKQVLDLALNSVLDGIKNDLTDFHVNFDEWFSERSLTETGLVENALNQLEASGHSYKKDGATWFSSTTFGDEKDRVIVRDNGQSTYFASDIAYLLNKIERGFDQIIYLWGADHHGYIPRMKAAAQALAIDPDRLDILLVQFANLYRDGQQVSMSTRSGQFVPLKELCEEVGTDAARFFYVMRRCEQHLDFDLDLAKSQSNENPVYYVQYAHARICSLWQQLDKKGLTYDENEGLESVQLLTENQEKELLKVLSRFPEIILRAATNKEPHLLTHYLREVSQTFHANYNANQYIIDHSNLRNARFTLAKATRQVLQNGLQILDVSAPQKM